MRCGDVEGTPSHTRGPNAGEARAGPCPLSPRTHGSPSRGGLSVCAHSRAHGLRRESSRHGGGAAGGLGRAACCPPPPPPPHRSAPFRHAAPACVSVCVRECVCVCLPPRRESLAHGPWDLWLGDRRERGEAMWEEGRAAPWPSSRGWAPRPPRTRPRRRSPPPLPSAGVPRNPLHAPSRPALARAGTASAPGPAAARTRRLPAPPGRRPERREVGHAQPSLPPSPRSPSIPPPPLLLIPFAPQRPAAWATTLSAPSRSCWA